MADAEEILLQTCPACGTEIDASGQEPLTAIICPVCGAPSVIAAQIDHFTLVDVIGRGGMGVVYKAHDTSLDRLVALKLLRKSDGAGPEQIAQLETEAAITASINHPHVVRVFSTGSAQGRFYIAMELVDKGTLDDLIGLQGCVAEAQVLDVGIQIASGLRAALQAGLIHRDVKPGNILFADAHTAKIVDFGLAVFMADEEKVRGEVWGTPYYVAPEKLDNKPEDFRSDMYSLGGTLFHALAGRPPFEAQNASMVALKHLKSQAVSLQAFAPQVSGSTAYVINRTLNKDPAQRYQSYDEFIEHLEYARAQLQASGGKAPVPQRMVLETEASKKAVGWVVFGMIGLMLLLGISAIVFRDELFGKGAAPAQAAGKGEAIFPAARAQLAEGKAVEAAEALRQAGEKKLPQPRLNWANLLEGLAHTVAGRRDDAQLAFQKISERGPYATKGNEHALAVFFVETAREMASDALPSPSTGAGDKTNFEAITPLLYGVKNWEMGKIEEAITHFRQFRKNEPTGPDAWINDLKPLATRYVEEFSTFELAADRLKNPKSPNEIKAAVEALKQIKGKLAGRARDLIAKGSADLAAAEKKRAQMLAEGRVPDGAYRIINRKTGKALDLPNSAKNDGQKLRLASYGGATNQKWNVTALGNGFFQIVSQASGKAVEVEKGKTGDGVPVQQWGPNKGPTQRWKIEKADGAFFKLTLEASGKALAAAPAPAADVVQSTYANAPEQQWRIEPL